MKQQEFNNTLERLKSDNLNIIKVVDADNLKTIVCNYNAVELTEKYGSVDDFFESLFKSGVKRIQISDRRKNGNTHTNAGEPYIFDFKPLDASAEVKTAAPIMPVLNGQIPNYGLNGGLNASIYRDMDHPRIQAELESSKAEVKRLMEDNRKMETELLVLKTLEGQSVAKTQANAQMMDSFAPILSALGEKLLTKAPEVATQGLAGANFSPIKRQSLELLNSLSDNEVSYINALMSNIDSPGVADGLITLLETSKIIPKTA